MSDYFTEALVSDPVVVTPRKDDTANRLFYRKALESLSIAERILQRSYWEILTSKVDYALITEFMTLASEQMCCIREVLLNVDVSEEVREDLESF